MSVASTASIAAPDDSNFKLKRRAIVNIYDTVYALTLSNNDPGVPPTSIVFCPEHAGVRITEYIHGRVSSNSTFIIAGCVCRQGELITINEARRIWNYLEGTCGYNRCSWAKNL